MVQGTASDQLSTVGLKTCIGIAAVRGTNKVLAHMNGSNGRGEFWDVQLQKFQRMVGTIGNSPKIWISFPDIEEGGSRLKAALEDMIVGVETAARQVDPDFKAHDQKKGTSGEMVIRQDGKVEMCKI